MTVFIYLWQEQHHPYLLLGTNDLHATNDESSSKFQICTRLCFVVLEALEKSKQCHVEGIIYELRLIELTERKYLHVDRLIT